MITTTITNIQAGDIPALLEIENSAYGDMAWTDRDFVRQVNKIGGSYCLKHTGTNKIVGYLFYIKDDEGGVEITNVAVHPEYRRMGLGTKLVEVLNKNKTFSEIYLSANEAWLPAHQFFKKLRFKAVKILSKFYDDGSDAYFFTNDLAQGFEYTYNKDKNVKPKEIIK